MIRLRNVTIDALDIDRMVEFWSAATGYRVGEDDGVYVTLTSSEQPFPRVLLQRVTETKASKNRVHLDLEADAPEQLVERLLDLGARRIETFDEADTRWVWLEDPEGNEFCVMLETSG